MEGCEAQTNARKKRGREVFLSRFFRRGKKVWRGGIRIDPDAALGNLREWLARVCLANRRVEPHTSIRLRSVIPA